MRQHFIDQEGRVVKLVPEKVVRNCSGCLYEHTPPNSRGVKTCYQVAPLENKRPDKSDTLCVSNDMIFVEVKGE